MSTLLRRWWIGVDVLAVAVGLGALTPALAGPDITLAGRVDDADRGQLLGVLAGVHGTQTTWTAPDEAAADPTQGPLLADAEARERALDLPGALDAYARACAAEPGETESSRARWQRGCEGAVRMAFGVEEPTALDEALRRLLHRRPDHPFPPELFPPPVAARARQLAANLPRGTLRIEGAPGTVLLDGEPRGQVPLRDGAVPAGEHEVQCSGWSARFTVQAGGDAVLHCPPADGATDGHALLATHGGGGAHWILVGVDSAAARISPGVWVFHGGETAVGLWAGPVPPASAIPTWEQRARDAASP